MSAIIYLIVSLLLAGFSFYVLYFDKFSFIKMPAWVFFYLGTFVLATLWLRYFFPEMSYEGTITGLNFILASLGKICLVLFVVAGFSFWVYIRNKKSDLSFDKVAKSVGGMTTVLMLTLILIASATAFGLRTNQESKMVTEDIVLDDIFPTAIESNVTICEGGSLCGTLCMTKEYALQFAKINNLKYHYHGDKLIVLVQPGDEFMPVGKLWTPVKK